MEVNGKEYKLEEKDDATKDKRFSDDIDFRVTE